MICKKFDKCFVDIFLRSYEIRTEIWFIEFYAGFLNSGWINLLPKTYYITNCSVESSLISPLQIRRRYTFISITQQMISIWFCFFGKLTRDWKNGRGRHIYVQLVIIWWKITQSNVGWHFSWCKVGTNHEMGWCGLGTFSYLYNL